MKHFRAIEFEPAPGYREPAWHAKARNMRRAQFSWGQIAKHFGVTRASARYAAKSDQMREKRRKVGAPRSWRWIELKPCDYARINRICDEEGTTLEAIRTKDRSKRASNARRLIARELHRIGCAHRQIGDVLFVSVSRVSQLLTERCSRT